MVSLYGKDFVEQMKIDAKKVIHNNEIDWDAKREHYEQETVRMLRPFGYASFQELLG